jgi:hypothetical protein
MKYNHQNDTTMRKNYIVPQLETTQVNHLVALCAGSNPANVIGVGGNSSENNISSGD